jgi:hypothetical protein
MSKLMQVLGIVLLAAGIALAIMGLVNQAQLQVRGIDMASAINLIVGGILAIGLGGVIAAVASGAAPIDYASEEAAPAVPADEPVAAVPEAKVGSAAATEEAAAPRPMRFPSFGRKLEESGVAAAPAAAGAVAEAVKPVVAKAEEAVTPAVRETIDALEQAKTDLENALSGTSDSVETMETATEEVAGAADGELFVVEDKVIRGRPARILSDGTVEAETEEGWMRFENLEHLDEYLDAVEQA